MGWGCLRVCSSGPGSAKAITSERRNPFLTPIRSCWKLPYDIRGGELLHNRSVIAYGRSRRDRNPKRLAPPCVGVRFKTHVTIASRGSVNRSVANCLTTIFDSPLGRPLSPLTASRIEPQTRRHLIAPANPVPHSEPIRRKTSRIWILQGARWQHRFGQIAS